MSAGKSSSLNDGLRETCRKADAALLASIEDHVGSSDYGLDFLDTKNSLLLSYLIELTAYLRLRLQRRRSVSDKNKTAEESGEQNLNSCLARLTEMKVCLDKTRGLDKKLRYQIDKLLAAGTTSTSFAAGTEEDPLKFRPNANALDDEDEDDDSSTSSSDGDDEDGRGGDDQYEENDLDDDLEAARLTLSMAKGKNRSSKKGAEDDDDESSSAGVYRAPRLAAVPYTHDKDDRQAEREKRRRQRMRASEVAQTLRSQYGEAPDQEDISGGTEFGRQREAARRMAQQRAEKTEFEEDNFVRLTTSRKERKERERLMRQENSNLAAIADVVRGSDFAEDGGYKSNKYSNDDGDLASERHSNGKRKRQFVDRDGRKRGSSSSSVKARNSLQAALFGGDGSVGKSKKNRK